jgi:hypothetical protein
MDGITQAKQDAVTVEFVKPGPLQQLPLPRELVQLNDDELAKLEKSLVRKLDSCFLPAVIILFLMNILDRSVVSFLACNENCANSLQ